ncbi:hypothetical protein BRD17_01640, partial [Halobacteriales archaeon SW_7_68_16]
TESATAIAMARHGGLGVLHRNMSIERTVDEIERVKRADDLVIWDVVTVAPDDSLREADAKMAHEGVSGAPVIGDDETVLGIISGTDIRPQLEVGEADAVREAMTSEVVTADEDITAREALDLMYDHKIERVPIVDDGGRLARAFSVTFVETREVTSASSGSTELAIGHRRTSSNVRASGSSSFVENGRPWGPSFAM